MSEDHLEQPTLTVGAECFLEGASEELTTLLKNKLTLPNPKYQAAQKYGKWVGNSIPRKLYFFHEKTSGLLMPRGFSREVIGDCRQLMKINPQIVDSRRVLPEHEFCFSGQLREYQSSAVQDILTRDFGVLEAGTGSGKTVMALKLIEARRQPTIILVHTKELLYQWADKIRQFLDLEAALIGDGNYDVGPVTVAIVHSARKHLDKLPAHFGHIIVDECHRVPASLFTGVVCGFEAKYSLGLTATAYRREDVLTRLIYFYMGASAHRLDSRELLGNGAILRPEIHLCRTEFTYRYQDDYAAMMSALTRDEARNQQIVDDVLLEAAEKSGILVVSDRVAHCERLVELIRQQGGKPELLTGRVGMDRRLEIVRGIRDNSVAILVATVQLVGEGFDAPGLNTLFLATPIKFSGRLKQVVGRVLRPSPGKKAKVVDYVDDAVGILKNSARQRQKIFSQY